MGRQHGEAVVVLLERADPSLLLALLPSEKLARQVSPASDASEGVDVLGAKFAPLAVPISRRKQAMACATVVYFPMLLLIVYSWSLARLRLSWPLCLLYSRLVDKEILSVAAWLSFRKNWLLQGCAAYFPATLFKADPTLTWDPNKAYLIGYHPHGVCGCGAALAFGTDVLGWREKFPGLEVRLATILMSWRLPLLWELLARLGCIPGDGTTS